VGAESLKKKVPPQGEPGPCYTTLAGTLPVIMDGPDYRAGRLAVVVTFDEDDHTADNLVLAAVIAPTVSHVVAGAPLTHYSLSRYLAELGGASPLGDAATAASLSTAFGL